MNLELAAAVTALMIALPLTGMLRLKTRPNRRPGFEAVPRVVLVFAVALVATFGYLGTMWNSARVVAFRTRRATAGDPVR